MKFEWREKLERLNKRNILHWFASIGRKGFDRKAMEIAGKKATKDITRLKIGASDFSDLRTAIWIANIFSLIAVGMFVF